MDPQDNKQLALQKAISSHEQAAAGLRDLQGGSPEGAYAGMLARIDANVEELRAEMARTKPEDAVEPA